MNKQIEDKFSFLEQTEDVTGRSPNIGDIVAFGQPSRGAQPLLVGEIIKINNKTVSIKYSVVGLYGDRKYDTVCRKSCCFAILNKENYCG